MRIPLKVSFAKMLNLLHIALPGDLTIFSHTFMSLRIWPLVALLRDTVHYGYSAFIFCIVNMLTSQKTAVEK